MAPMTAPPMAVPPMDSTRLNECLNQDFALLRTAVTTTDPKTRVPSCPDWTVDDLADHVAHVYLHKAESIRLGAFPDPWPPEQVNPDTLARLDENFAALQAQFAAHSPADHAATWHDVDQTVGFWIRRMAQETVIHRIDAELAAGLPVTPVPDDLAADGVDEVLKRMLAYGSVTWPEDFAEMEGEHLVGPGEITVAAGQAAWTVRPSPHAVEVEDGASDDPRAVVDGPAGNVLRWLWGRAGDDAIRITGDAAWADYLRRLLAVATQ